MTGTTNSLTAAQAETLSKLKGFALSAGATLNIADNATDLLSAADAGGEAVATSFTLTGTTNSLTAAQAETLSKLKGFALSAGATLNTGDNATDLLNPANAGGEAVATSVTLTGANPGLTAAQAETLSKLKGFALGQGATLAISDSAANLLNAANAGGEAVATSVTLTGTNAGLTAAQAQTLSKLKSLSLATGATLGISDNAADLLNAANAGGEAVATSFTLTGTTNSVTAAQAETLSKLKGFALGSGATLNIADNATDLLNAANASGEAVATSFTLTGATNSVTAALAETLSKLKGFALASGATLNIADNATDLLNAANAGGEAVATSVTLTGTNAGLTAAQAETLSKLKGFALGAGATLGISDNATDLLNAANAGGEAVATSFTLTGTNSVTAAQAETLSKLKGFALGAGATLNTGDNATDLLNAANAGGEAVATSFTLTGTTNSVTAAQAETLSKLKSLSLATGATLGISDNAADLLNAANAGGEAVATSVTLTGTNAGLTAAQAETLSKLKGFALGAGATLNIADNATDLLNAANAGGEALATSFTLTGTTNSVTAALAETLSKLKGFALGSGATLNIADNATDLLNAANAGGEAVATSFTLTGTTNSVTAAQSETLSKLKGFALGAGATLNIADNSTDLLNAADAGGEAVATSFTLTGTNSVNAAQAERLSKLKGFALGPGATLNIADNATDLLNAANAGGEAVATSFTLTGTNSVTAAQAETLSKLKGFALGAGATLHIADNSTDLLNAADAGGEAVATSFTLTGTNSVTAAQAERLSKLKGFALGPGATLNIADNATDLLNAANAGGEAVATSFTLTGTTSSVTAAQAETLSKLKGFALGSGATLNIADNATDLLNAADAGGEAVATSFTLTGTTSGVTAAQAETLSKLKGFALGSGATLNIADNATDLLNAADAGGEAVATSFTLTGTTSSVTAAQAETLSKLKSLSLATGATLGISDNAADLLAAANAGGEALATSVTLTGTNAGLTAAQAETLSKLKSLSLATGATLGISDNAADLLAAANAGGEALATSVTLTGTNASLTAAQAEMLSKLKSFSLATGATLGISDNAADLLNAANAGGEAIATSVTLTGTNASLTAAQAETLSKLKGFALGAGATLNIADSATDLLNAANAGGEAVATSVTLTGANPGLTAAQAETLSKLKGFALGSGATLGVSDSAANFLNAANAGGEAVATSVTLTGVNAGLTAAQAETLSKLKGFSLATGATLAISDNATDLLNPANAGGEAVATSVTLTGANPGLTAGQAETLSKLKGFALGQGATLGISDNAADLLAVANAGGEALAISFTLTGTNSVTAAQAETLSKLKSLSLATGATLGISDNAADLLAAANAGGEALATSVTLTGTNAGLTAAQAETLSKLKSLSLATGATLGISDNAADLLAAANAGGEALATSVTLTGTNAGLTAAQAETLSKLKSFSLATGATLGISDNAADLLNAANAGGEAVATSFTLTGTTNSVTAAQAETLSKLKGFALGSGATLNIADNATDLLNAANAGGEAVATSFTLTGTTNSVTAAQAETLSKLPGFALGAGATLNIADNATDLLAVANAGGEAVATSVTLTGTTNSVTAAQAETLSKLKGFSLATGATLGISDNAADLLAVANAGGEAVATSVTLTGANPGLTAAQAETLSKLKGFALGQGATLAISDNATDLLNPANAGGEAVATSVTLTGANAGLTAAQAETLSKLKSFSLATGAKLNVADNAADLLAAANAGGEAVANSVTLTGTNPALAAAQAETLSKLPGFALGAGATLNIADNATDLLNAANAGGEAVATSFTLTGTTNSVTAAQAETLSKLKGFALGSGATLNIADNAADLLNAANAGGEAVATSVTLTGANAGLSAAQAETLSKLKGFSLAMGATLAISDNATDLLNAANAGGEAVATSVTLTGTNSVTAAQAETLSKLKGFALGAGATLNIADNATDLLNAANAGGEAVATSFTLTGTTNSVTAALAETLSKLKGFALGAGATLNIADSATDLLSAANAGGEAIATSFTLTGTNSVTAAQAETLSKLKGFVLGSGATASISDTASSVDGLTASEIAEFASTLHVSHISASDATVRLTVSQAAALEVAKIKVTAPTKDVVQVSDTATNLESLSAPEIAGLAGVGVDLVYDSSGNVSFTAAQTIALASSQLAIGAAGSYTVTEFFSNGGYDVSRFNVTGLSYTSYEDLFSGSRSELAEARALTAGGGALILDAGGLTATAGGSGALSVTSGGDVYALTPGTNEAITTTSESSETFVLESGFGADSVTGLVLGSATGHDALTFQASAFGLTATDQARDLTALLKDTHDNTAGNAVITDTHGDTLTLIGVSTSQLKSAPSVDFKFV